MNSNETKTKEATAVIDINDYRLDKKPNEYVKAASPYKVIFQNSSDFIISRKKGRIDKELVVLISEGLFYFKDKDKIEEVTPEKLKTFLRDLRGLYITLDQVLWLPALSKDGISRLINVITNPTYIDMARSNVLTENTCQPWCAAYWDDYPEIFEEVHSAIHDINFYHYRTCMNAAYEIVGRFGYDAVMHFIEGLNKSNFTQISFASSRYFSSNERMDGFFQLLEAPYNLEICRLIDYTFIDSYAQGITNINEEFWQAYENYLNMQIQIFGEVRDKYPRYLITSHNVTALNMKLLENIPSDEDFEGLTAEVRGMAYEDKTYSIIIPATARQIAEEGIALNHCMGSNAESITSGDMQILFLRDSGAKDKSLVTLRYNNDMITGAEGMHRRGLTKNERKFLETWGKEMDVEIAA